MSLLNNEVYYAHAMGYYGSERERKSHSIIENLLGRRVCCPNQPHHEEGFQTEGMAYFDRLLDERPIGSVVFETYDDGAVGAGVAYEVKAAFKRGLEVWRIRHWSHGRSASLEFYQSEQTFDQLRVLERAETRERNRAINPR